MRNLIPKSVIWEIGHHIRERVIDAEYGFQFAAADEDSVTGALGQVLLASPRLTYDHDPDRAYQWSFTYRKIRGRGKGAPEKRIGADGIFQIEISDDEGNRIFTKGLLFQAKKNWNGKDSALQEQCTSLSKIKRGSIVIDYTSNGYSAARSEMVVKAEGNRRSMPTDAVRPLADVLANDYVNCLVGVKDLFFDLGTETLSCPLDAFGDLPAGDLHIINTSVVITEM